jgi:hypothetical protein
VAEASCVFPSKAGLTPYDRMSNAADREDFLSEDAEVPGQKFVLLSFLSPEKVLKDKNIFMFERFLQGYEFQSRTKNLEAWLMKSISGINAQLDAEADKLVEQDLSGAADICRKSKIRMDTLMDEFQSFVKGNERELRESQLKEKWDDFMFANKVKLEDDFYAKNEFRTTVRGLKVRGTYSSQAEAVARSKKLQRNDPLHNIFVGEVGKWLPWDPEPNDVAEQEYAEEQLNTLMKKYKENEEQREEFQREQRNRAKSGKKPAAAPGITVLNDAEAAAAVAGAEGEGDGSKLDASVTDMFGSEGPADLAIARKMAAKKPE